MTVQLTPGQVRILKTLSESPLGLTRREIDDAVGTDIAEALGPKYVDDLSAYNAKHGKASLLSLGMVRGVMEEGRNGKDEFRYLLTSKGSKAAGEYATKRVIRKEDRIPAKVLNPAVLKLKNLRTYGFEQWTNEDIRAVLEQLPEQYQINDRLPADYLESVRQQIINQRKIGAYADNGKEEDSWPEWYQDYRESPWWDMVRSRALELWDNGCCLNATHGEGVDVWHRRFVDASGESLLGREEDTDVIVLCAECRKRNRKACAVPPRKQP